MEVTFSWVWSASKAAFFPAERRDAYVAMGTWPSDAVPVSTEVRDAYAATAFDGKMLAADVNGRPTRVAIPTQVGS